MIELAIVIPAYKQAYLNDTLQSLASQTNQNFNLYIGDDCSPFDLQTVIAPFKEQLRINYTRFPDNIGAKNLVLQWSRCMELAVGAEKWLWLFSDDDICDPQCVENFYKIIAEKGDQFDVYRFNTVTIDEEGNLIQPNRTGPQEESSEQMAYHLLKTERGNSMPDHIFTRKVYEDTGGFVFTQYAQGADWATSIRFSKAKGMCIIPDALVHWRYSGQNISSSAPANVEEMIGGHLQFLQWCKHHFNYLRQGALNGVTYRMIQEALQVNLNRVMLHHFKGIGLKRAWRIYTFFVNELNAPRRRALMAILEIDSHYNKKIAKLFKFINKTEGFLNRNLRLKS